MKHNIVKAVDLYIQPPDLTMEKAAEELFGNSDEIDRRILDQIIGDNKPNNERENLTISTLIYNN